MTRFDLWAPAARRVRVQLSDAADTMDLEPGPDGWWHADVEAPPGTDYAYLLDDASKPLPDPRSRWQPFGVHGPSRVYDDAAFAWTDHDWPGRDLQAAVIYELHIGTFTPGATFDSALERLDHLVRLGITHVEVMPINAFNGTWNWGYDGVAWYAVHDPYGGPDGFKRFVDACHARGLAVVLDVVYNHLGPSGNYLPEFGPYLKEGRSTWGDYVNLEATPVRRFVIENALMWLRDYHVDALRLDAVHALVDSSTPHLLAELSTSVARLSAQVGRPLSLIAESDLNDPVMITPVPEGHGLDAQWDDDIHHALHAMLTGERQGYYVDFGSLAVFAKVWTAGFLHDGTYSTFREKVHGRPLDRDRTPGYRLVAFLQDHDQVGNRAAGDRLGAITSPALLAVGAVLLLTAPFTPMLWMGEEWAASTPWPFFASHPEPQLAAATRSGRIEEFRRHGWDAAGMVDPQDPQAYRSAVLDWDEAGSPGHRDLLELYRRLIALRAAEQPLRDPALNRVRVDFGEDDTAGARWLVVHRGPFRVAANLGKQPRTLDVSGEIVLATGPLERTPDGLTLGAETAAVVRSS